MKEKIIYTRSLANKLVAAGFPVVRVEENPNKTNFDCYVFEDTAEFKAAFTNIVNQK